MADPKIRIRRSATPNKVPTTTQLQLGELAINTYDGKVYLEQDQGGVGVGTTVIAVNPWGVGIGSTAFSTQFTAGKVGIATTNPQYSLDVGGDINFSGNLFQDGSEFTSGVGIRTAGGTVGWAATIIDFRGPGVTTAYYSTSTGIGTVYFQGGGGGGNASVTVADAAPSSPSNGDLWFKSDVGELYLWYTDGSSNQWVEASGGSNTVITSDTAPSSPQDGDLWWNSDTGELKVYYNDGNSSQWVDANSEGGFVQYWTQTNTNGTLGVTTTSFVGIGTTTATDALTVRGNANVTGFLTAAQFGSITTPGINVTGVATALQLKGPLTSSGINVTGVSTFSGDVKIGGVLTYEDVKNVDAIGVVTARKGIKALAGGANIVDGTTTDELNVTGISTFAGNIDVNADLDVDGHTELDNVNVVGIATIQQVKATTLNVTGVSTVTGGVKVGTAATICSAGNMTIDKTGAGIITATKFIGDGSDLTGVISGIGIGTAGGVVGYAATIVHFKGAGVTTAYYSSSTGVGTVFFHSAGGGGSANVTIADAPPGSPTAGDLWWESDIGELKIYYNDGNSAQWVDASGADSLVQIGTSAPTGAVSGDLWWNSESGDFMVYYTDANSSAWVSVNAVNADREWITNSTGIHTTANVGIGTTTATDPLTVVGATDLDGTLLVSGITTFGSHVYHGDNDHAIFGDGSDLSIYHSGSHSYIKDSGTGALILNSNEVVIKNAADNEDIAKFTQDEGAELYWNNTKRFSTNVGGAKVWGTVGSANTALVVVGDARVTGILTVGTGSLKITDRDINMVGVITGANFKSGTTNVHNVGVEAAGINVLGADTPIGTGATVYNSGLIVSKKGAEFQGVVTATTFKGAVTGNATGLSGTPNITVGALTASTGQFSGDVNVLGTLTYEDVKNVDSAGIATARQGLRITGGGLDVVGISTFHDDVMLLDNDILRIGSSSDLQIFHTGSESRISDRGGVGSLNIESNNLVSIRQNDAAHYMAKFYQGGAVQLYHNNVLKFETVSYGVVSKGSVEIQSGSMTTADSSNSGVTNSAIFGAGSDLKIYHSGSHSYIKHSGTGNLYTDIGVGDQYSITVAESAHCADFVGGGAVTLRYNGNAKLATTNTGVSVTGAITASQGGTITGNTQFNGAVDIGDDNGSNNYRVRLGASQDLSLWHDGTNSYVSNTTGDLFVQTAASKAVYIRPNNGANGIICHPAGAVDLYHNANKKLETTSTGVMINDDVILRSSGELILNNAGNSANAKILCDGGARIHLKSYNQTMATMENGQHTIFYTNSGTERLRIQHDGTSQFQLQSNILSQTSPPLVLCSSTNTAMRANFLLQDDYPSGRGSLAINVTESGVTNDRDLLLQRSGGRVGINCDPNRQFEIGNVANAEMQLSPSDGNTGESRIFIGGNSTNQNKCAIIHDPAGGYCRGNLHFCLENTADTSNVDSSDSKVVIMSDGKMGVGITPFATGLFHVGGNIVLSSSTNAPKIIFEEHAGTDPKAEIRMDQIGSSDAQLQFYTEGGGTLSERMRINNSGNIGINETSPAHKLHVNGDILTSRIYIGNGGNAIDPMIRNASDTNTGIYFPGADEMAFSTGGVERFKITTSKFIFADDNPYIIIQDNNSTGNSQVNWMEGQDSNGTSMWKVGNTHNDQNTLWINQCNNASTKFTGTVSGDTFEIYGNSKTFAPCADNVADIGSGSKRIRNLHVASPMLMQGVKAITGNYSANTWYGTGWQRDNMEPSTSGTYLITALSDTHGSGTNNYSMMYTWIVGLRNQSTNQTAGRDITRLSISGHSDNGNISLALRTYRIPASQGGIEYIQWSTNVGLSNLDNSTGGRILRFYCQKLTTSGW